MIGKHHNLSNQSGQQSNGGKPKTNVTNNVAPTPQHACFTYCFFKDTSNNQKKGQWRRSYNNPTKMKSLQKFHGKLACHPSCRGEGCGSSTISCTILLMPAAIMLDEKNWWLNLELGTQSVCRTEAGWCMLVHRNPTTTKNKETWCQRLRFLPFCSGFRLFTLIISRLPYLSK